MPDVVSFKRKIFENILPVIEAKTDVHVTWLVYMPQKVNSNSKNLSYSIIDIHNFRNAVEVVQTVKPDIIYGSPTVNLPDIALTLAGRFLKVPVVGELINESLVKTKLLETLRSHTSSFFASSVPTDVTEEKQFMKRGRFFIYKYIFLLRTQIAIGMSLSAIVKSFFTIAKSSMNTLKKLYYPDFACDLNFIESERLIEPLIKDGFDRSSLVVTGIPQYDPIFKKLQNPHIKNDEKIHILLATHSMFEHGFHTRVQRDSIVKQTVEEICKHKDKISLVVKIHPSSESLSEYQNLIHTIDSTIPIYKDGDAVEFLEKSDIVISYSTSSVPMMATILKKPIIFCNFYCLEEDVMLERGLAYDCKDASFLIPAINNVLSSNPATKEKTDQFIRDIFYRGDGCASERVVEAIFSLLEKRQHSKINNIL